MNNLRMILLSAVMLVLAMALPLAAKTPDGMTPAQETVCDGEKGAAFGLCNAYCEAMDCESDAPKASIRGCERVLANFQKHTGRLPPCINICPNLPVSVEGYDYFEQPQLDNTCETDSQCVAAREGRVCVPYTAVGDIVNPDLEPDMDPSATYFCRCIDSQCVWNFCPSDIE